jgi:hypothetical protein
MLLSGSTDAPGLSVAKLKLDHEPGLIIQE